VEPGTPAIELSPVTVARVGVVVIDHDGGDLTRRCVESIAATDWPSEALSVVVVDNNGPGSDLADRLAGAAVEVVDAGGNRGFAGGCNLGIEALGTVDYVALLNNDATVDPSWLTPLVAALEADSTVGAACPKILFDGSFVAVAVQSATAPPGGGDARPLGVAVRGVRLDGVDAWRSVQLVTGFWGVQHDPGDGGPYQWTNGDAVLRLPARRDGTPPCASLLLSAPESRAVEVTSGDRRVTLTVGVEAAWFDVELGGQPVDVINNVGSVLLDGGYGADRGYLERDDGQYSQVEEVFAWCGAAVVLSRRYLDTVGDFDESYFLYYEDFDLSWRGRAQGWRYLYVPGPPVRHVHSASAVEGSRLHHHFTERNRMLTLARNAPAPMAAAAVAHHLLVTASYARRDVLQPLVRRQSPSWETVRRRSVAFASFTGALPRALVRRRELRRRRQVDDVDLLRWASAPGR
jgi:GT2 family glycosyltransferase